MPTSGTRRRTNGAADTYQRESGFQQDEQSYEQAMPNGQSSGVTYQDQASNRASFGTSVTYKDQDDEASDVEAIVEEMGGAAPGVESDMESDQDDLENHRPVHSPARSAVTNTKAATRATESADTESEFEAVEGWDARARAESTSGDEALIEAYYADSQTQEFLPALGALLVPLAKTILPTIAGAVVQQGARALNPRVQGLLRRLSALGINPAQLKRRESDAFGDVEGMQFDEATLSALEGQIEALEVIIGTDDRVRVMNTKVVPWLRICHLRIQAASGSSYLGTGFFVGPRTIITAGHCVYIHGQGGWARQITVTPGRNGSEEPFGTFVATELRSVRGWVNGKSRNHDYGAIILPRSARVPASVGAFGFGVFSDAYLGDKRLNTAGYPGDKPSGTMWYHGRVAKSLQPRTITYDIDTMGGQSGSAVWIRTPDGRRIVVGIHTNGAPSGNSATRVTRPVFDNLKRWREEGGTTL